MSLQASSLNDLADTLIQKLTRENIFPPQYNNPEHLLNDSKRNKLRPPRPPNGFLLCRKNVHQEAKKRGICNMRVISKVTGMLWRAATLDEKEEYERLAIKVHNLHSQRYPGYKYRPAARDRSEPYNPYVFSSSPSPSTSSFIGYTSMISSSVEQPIHQASSNSFTANPINSLFDFTQEQLELMTLYLGMSNNSINSTDENAAQYLNSYGYILEHQ
ncbi:13462_t:CDS:1 [Funneliformis caledonium]|uniref:13462_t:CDS:1 n=1 Tax=Funneliformis caledonium TaxID=1117310 RepID=A0A9N8VB00_9GLOM|nr:13462_t:CDS:1 [Funneliformis caledonium]